MLMELSSKVEYALIALMELSKGSDRGEPVQVKQIAARQGIPDRYLEQIFAALRHAGLIQSQRGNKGGYLLAREAWQLALIEILDALEDHGHNKSRQDIEPGDRAIVREIWQQAHHEAREVLRRHTLQDLCSQRDIRQRLSDMYYI
ncbi:transcriptional regulator, BadM/Rrf2 family [Geitlerinema sp. PCC 7407]|nr:transcriptional regulator, BadM/Rrf2 family [Geitlerinema sp. PCC 7407]